MGSASIDLNAILDRALNYAAQNLRVEKLILQLGLDPAHLTVEVVLDRLIDIALANINIANTLALIGAIFYVATLMVRTIVPLRVIGIVSMVFFIAYGALAGAMATFLLYLIALPINVIRLRQMLGLVRKARQSAQGDLSMDWLRPFMTPRRCRAGEVLFRKGDLAKDMFYTLSGRFLVEEIGVELPPQKVFGELGFVTANNRRTQTVVSLDDGEVLSISYDRLLELYFQNPEFGYYFLKLATGRLMQNAGRLERELAQAREALAAAGIALPAPDAAPEPFPQKTVTRLKRFGFAGSLRRPFVRRARAASAPPVPDKSAAE